MSCLTCGHDVIQFLDLGVMAYANAFIDTPGQFEEKSPLRVGFCNNCHLMQLMDIVDRDKLFSNYTYFTHTSPQLIKHFNKYADYIAKQYPEKLSERIVEIASNSGVLIKALKERGATNIIGIDPAKNVAMEANSEGVETICAFFNADFAKTLDKASLVVANNVLAHLDNPRDFLDGVRELLTDDGIFVCEVQYLRDLILERQWTNIYHEHTAYFSLQALENLLGFCGLFIVDVQHVKTQGGSLRIWASKKYNVKSFKALGFEQHLYSLDTFLEFAKCPTETKTSLRQLLKDLKKDGKVIAGYGAPAKGNTLLQYCGVGPEFIDYITDEAPSKQYKFTPGTHIPVVPRDMINKKTPNYLLLLAWNYAASIREREKGYNGKFITTVPYTEVL